MTPTLEHLPVRPRKASAARRRRNIHRLPAAIHQIVPGAATVLFTPVWTDLHGPAECVYVATAWDDRGQQLRIPPGGSRRLAALIQGAYPIADWDQPQTWHDDTNRLAAYSARTSRPTTTRGGIA